MKNLKKGFTLIELLVVIAIIAILAAILFPVFAQAKLAAKGAASISNAKQIALSITMYSGDNDDYAPMETSWNTGNDQYGFGAGASFSPWSYNIMPYTKNGDIMEDPLTTANPASAGTNMTVWYGYNSQFGYNYNLLSPWVGGDTGLQAASMTSVSKPADYVMVTGLANHSVWTSWPSFGVNQHLPAYGVDAPECYTNQYYCWDNWGHNSAHADWLGNSEVEGAFTGGVAIRKSGQGVTAFCDGHVKTLSPGALAAGTNWSKTSTAGELVINDASKYIWGDR
jgi:prepilin-type N-terminal cleavage/methylation domain-containing protein